MSGYAALLALVTLTPAPWAAEGAELPFGVLNPSTWIAPVTWTTGAPHEFVANILLFLPAGVLLFRFGAVRAVVLSAAVTLSIEVAQVPVVGRISDPRDFVANVTGALLGVGIATGFAKLKGARTARAFSRPEA